MVKIKTFSTYETEKIGEKLAEKLKGNEIIALYGGMGAGKTAFVRGLSRGLEVEDGVSSPTFAIVHEYIGKYNVYHFDSKTKKRVSNKKLYKKYKISRKDMKAWAAQAFDQEYANEYFDNVKELRAQTMGLLPSNLDVFYHKGKLNILIPIATNYGSGTKMVLYRPNRKKSYKIEDSSTFDQMTLTLKNNKISLYYSGTDKTYKVHGCFNEYKQVHVYEIGPGVTYGFALTTNGLVEVIAIEDGLPINRVCSQGPLYGLDKVKSLRAGQALTEKDQLIDLFDALRNQPFKNMEGTYTNDEITLQIEENGVYALQGKENSHSGLLFSVGMEEEGLVVE